MRVRRRRAHDHGELLARVAEQHVPCGELLLRRRDRLAGRAALAPVGDPARVRLPRREPLLDLAVRLETALGINDEHLARSEPAPAHGLALGEVEHARLRRADDEVRAGGPAQRPQSVAVERGADDAAVAEDDSRGPVPRLDEARVVAVERAHVEVELGVVLPRGRHEHRERVPDVAPAAHEQLGRVVEHPGVGARLVERRDAVERAGPRAHPVHVAADRVDLAVVAQQAERLRPLPRGLGIGREALVEDPERHLEPRIAQIRIEGVELVGGAERLVDDGSEGKGGGVDIGAAVEPLPRGVGAPLGLVGRDPPRTLEHGLGDERRRRARGVAERGRVDGNGAPPAHGDPLGRAGPLDRPPPVRTAQEHHGEAQVGLRHERGRKRQEQAGAVARPSVRGEGSPVANAVQRLEEGIEDEPRGPAGEPGDEPDATGIAFGCGDDVRRGTRHLRTFRSSGEGDPPFVLASRRGRRREAAG